MEHLYPGALYELPERGDYVKGTALFFSKAFAAAKERRKEYTLTHTQEERRAAFRAMLGFPLSPTPEKNEILVRKKVLMEDERFTAYSMQLEIMEDLWLYGVLLEPSVKHEKNAFVVFQHGGLGIPEMISGLVPPTNYHDLAQNVLSDGVYVFCPQLFHWSVEDWGTPYSGAHIDGAFRMLGGSKTAFGVYGIERVIDYFSSLPEIDTTRIGMAGLSYGGMYTLVSAALDTRIRFAVSSCFVNDRALYPWSDWCYFGQAEKFFDAEIMTLISPRPFFAEVATRDNLFSVDGFRSVESDYSFYKEKLSLADNCRFHVFEGGHEFGTDGENLRFLQKYL